MSELAVAVAVASRDRPLRLRWLLNALAEQTFPAARFEVLVAHDPSSHATAQLLRTHPLQASGRLRGVTFPPGSTSPGAGRNAAWQAARAPLILFTDDDCRPRADWVAQAFAAASAHPGDIVQGQTLPDPDEAAVLTGAPWTHTVHVVPPTPWAETCNIAYPRELLEQLGGFDPRMRVAEDTDLAFRARRIGIGLVAAPRMLVYHAVQERWLFAAVRSRWCWQDVALAVKRHPELRRQIWGRVWWKREHAALAGAVLGCALLRRERLAAGLTLPWLSLAVGHRGHTARGLLRSISELPGRAALDATEIATLACGSVRHRTLLL